MMHLNPDGDFDAIVAKMNKAAGEVTTLEITTATRSVEIDGVAVEQGQVIALVNGKLAASTSTVEEACLTALEKIGASGLELITMFSGEDLATNEANRIADLIRKAYPSQEIELQDGGQPHYQFIISVE
jgi:hypothetical protein